MLTAVKASISTPVLASLIASAWTLIQDSEGTSDISTLTLCIGTVWHRGSKRGVSFAARIPETSAICWMLPLLLPLVVK